MNKKLKEIAKKVIDENYNQDEYKFFVEFANMYGLAILQECIAAVTEEEYPNVYGEITGVKAIRDRFELE